MIKYGIVSQHGERNPNRLIYIYIYWIPWVAVKSPLLEAVGVAGPSNPSWFRWFYGSCSGPCSPCGPCGHRGPCGHCGPCGLCAPFGPFGATATVVPTTSRAQGQGGDPSGQGKGEWLASFECEASNQSPWVELILIAG